MFLKKMMCEVHIDLLYYIEVKQLTTNHFPSGPKYSAELQNATEGKLNNTELSCLESSIVTHFSDADPTKIWREGNKKSSFNYILLDPRITKNLPKQAKIIGKYQNILLSILE